MSASENDQCPRCGAAVPAASRGRLCPACLISAALETPMDGSRTVPAEPGKAVSTLPPEPAEFPCELGGYRLLGLLGRGGMGSVFEAEQLATGRRVALKMLGRQLDSPEMRQRFLREGRLAARVNHPNSLYIFGCEEIDGLPVITMEIAGGGTLKDTLKQRGPLPVAEAVDAILDVIAGLESAFAVGVLHRDIKPSNCFVAPDGSVKVGDFGLSVSTLVRTDSFITAHGKILGTPAYASPEQLRGDALDVRADIYSVGATLFTLLTDRAPFEGENAVQVVANAVNQKPKPLGELRPDAPPGLERVVARCLAKEPDERFASHAALRDALLPFSSREPEPASMKVRAAAGWIDYLIAFMIPYVTLMLAVGAEEFHLQPLLDRTLHSARYYFAFLACGFLYFAVVEGIWGAGLGKRLKGLRVVRPNGRPPGLGRALLRVLVPMLSIECLRVPFLFATISATHMGEITWSHVWLYAGASNVFPWVAVLLAWGARRENGFAATWDRLSGTRVIVEPRGIERPAVRPAPVRIPPSAEAAEATGPYEVIQELVPGEWLLATDPILRRRVWLLRRTGAGPSPARRNVARPGRPRWLQKVEAREATWDAFEAGEGIPFVSLVEGGKKLPWSSLRHWLHDLASELWEAAGDGTLPAELSLDHVWISEQGRAVLLDRPWPEVKNPATRIQVRDFAGQQRFLNAVASCVDSTGLPLHARPALENLAGGRFEKLSFLTGTLRGLLERPVEVSRGVRAGAAFMLPLYIWIVLFVPSYQPERVGHWQGSLGALAVLSLLGVLGGAAVIQLLELPFRRTFSQSIFRLAIVDARGQRAAMPRLLLRWAITWLPLLVPMLLPAWLLQRGQPGAAVAFACVWLLLWIGAAVHAALHPHRGLHDRLAGTWVVRR